MTTNASLHIIDHIGMGGAQRIIEGILKKRPQDKVYYLNPIKKPLIDIKSEQFLFLSTKSKLKHFETIFSLSSKITNTNIQIIHCHLKFSWLLGILLKIFSRKLSDIKIIFHEHDPEIFNKRYYPLFLRFATHYGRIIVVSKFLLKKLSKFNVPKEKIFLLHNFVDTDRFHPIANYLSNSNKKMLEIGFVGRLVERKGWKDLLKIAVLLRDEKIVMRVVGIGKDKHKFLNAVDVQSLTDIIKFEGASDKVFNFYHSIDLLVMPSLCESSGLVQLEAQASGVPVIAYDIAGVNEIISSDNAILIPQGDVNLVAQEIMKLSKDSERYKSLVTRGLINANQYSLTLYVQELERYYAQLSGGELL